MQVLLILNPAAGKKKARTGLCDIVEGFCRADCQVTVFTTLRAGHAARLAAEYAPSHDLIVCCGGDGTLNEVVAGLLTSGCPKPLGYIPAGTTNDFAASPAASPQYGQSDGSHFEGRSPSTGRRNI